MLKTKAVEIFETQARLARAVGVGGAAVSKWPDVLPPKIGDRVIAACVRAGIDPSPLLVSEIKEAA